MSVSSNPSPVSDKTRLAIIARTDRSLSFKKNQTLRVLNEAISRDNGVVLRPGRHGKRSAFSWLLGPIRSHTLLVSNTGAQRDVFLLEGSQKRPGSKVATHVVSSAQYNVASPDKQLPKHTRVTERESLRLAHEFFQNRGQESYLIEGLNKQGKRSAYLLLPKSETLGVPFNEFAGSQRPSELVTVLRDIKAIIHSASLRFLQFSDVKLVHIRVKDADSDANDKTLMFSVAPDKRGATYNPTYVDTVMKSLIDELATNSHLKSHQIEMLKQSVLDTPWGPYTSAFTPEQLDADSHESLPLEVQARLRLKQSFDEIFELRKCSPVDAVELFVRVLDEAGVNLGAENGKGFENKGYKHAEIKRDPFFRPQSFRWPFSLRTVIHEDSSKERLIMANIGVGNQSFSKLKGSTKYVRFQYSWTERTWKSLKLPNIKTPDVESRFESEARISKAVGSPDKLVQVSAGGKKGKAITAILGDKMEGDVVALVCRRFEEVKAEPKTHVTQQSNSELYGGLLTPLEMITIVNTLAENVKRLHDQRILHCDIKLDNMLFRGKQEALEVRLDDFDLSLTMTQGEDRVSNTYRGTSSMVAPELVSDYERTGKSNFTKASDYFAMGMTLWNLFCGEDDIHEELNGVSRNYISGVQYRKGTVQKFIGFSERKVSELFDKHYGKFMDTSLQTEEEKALIKTTVLSCLKTKPSDRLSSASGVTIDSLCEESHRLREARLASGTQSLMPDVLPAPAEANDAQSEEEKVDLNLFSVLDCITWELGEADSNSDIGSESDGQHDIGPLVSLASSKNRSPLPRKSSVESKRIIREFGEPLGIQRASSQSERSTPIASFMDSDEHRDIEDQFFDLVPPTIRKITPSNTQRRPNSVFSAPKGRAKVPD